MRYDTTSEEVICDKHRIMNFIARTGMFGPEYCDALIKSFNQQLNMGGYEEFEDVFLKRVIEYLEAVKLDQN